MKSAYTPVMIKAATFTEFTYYLCRTMEKRKLPKAKMKSDTSKILRMVRLRKKSI